MSSEIKLDYELRSAENRKNYVEKKLNNRPNASYNKDTLEAMADYLVFAENDKEKKKEILTQNRLVTIGKRETSLQGMNETLEYEDLFYHYISDNNKNAFFQPKDKINKKDYSEIDYIGQIKEDIDAWEEALPKAKGHKAYVLKKSIIEMYKDQYIIKQAMRKPILFNKVIKYPGTNKTIHDEEIIIKKDDIEVNGLTLINPEIVFQVMSNYSNLKEETYDDFQNDVWYLIRDFERYADKALENEKPLKTLMIYKIDGLPATDVQKKIKEECGIDYSLEYISNLWRKKIPKLIAQVALEEYLIWHYKKNKKPLKKCSKCGDYKPMSNFFYSKNRSSSDGYYSVCKECRRKGADNK